MAYQNQIIIKKCYRWLSLFLFLSLMQACSHESKNPTRAMLTIEKQTYQNPLFFTGSIRPLYTVAVTSPVEGVITAIPLAYGSIVTKNQLLFSLSSKKFLTEYKTALMDYVKNKNDFNNGKTQLSEAIFLHQHQLISDDDFKMKQSTYYTARLAWLEAKDSLQNLLNQLNMRNTNIDQLSIINVDQVIQTFQKKINAQSIPVFSPAAGIVLSPHKSEDNKKKETGESVKQGEVLALIGDMSGIKVRVKVNELMVNQLQEGQSVQVTGLAFSDTLKGHITRIDREGEMINDQPVFPVEIVVPHLTLEQQHHIHVGMSAKAAINFNESNQIMVPFSAIQENNGISYVKRYNENLNTIEKIPVQTGKTTLGNVVVIAGLKVGDKIATDY